MSKNTIKYIIFAAVFTLPFVPLIVSSSLFFPFITGKAFAFRILVQIALAAYILLAVRDASYRPKFSWVLGSVIVFLVAIGLADVFAENPFKAFWSNYERMEGYVTMLHLGAMFLVMGSVLKTQEIWNRLIGTSLFASFIMAIYSFFQIGGKIAINQGGVRVDGTLGNASYLGIYMVFHIFLAALLFIRSKENWQKALVGIVGILNLIVLYHTATRGAILGLLGGAFISFVYLLFRSERGDKIRKISVVGAIALLVLVGAFFSIRKTDFVTQSPVLSRFSTLSFSEIRNQGRYYVWPMAIKGFLENPILGWGQEGFNFVFNKYYDPKMYTQEPWFDRAHNTFLDWLIAGGLLGFLSYISIIIAFFVSMSKAESDKFGKEDRAVLYGLMSAYMFHNLFVFDQISSYILFFTVLSYAHSHSVETTNTWWEKISAKFKSISDNEKWHPVTDAVVLIAFVLFLFVFVINPWRYNTKLLEVLRLNNQGTIASLDSYTAPLKKYTMAFPESLEHISQTAMSIQMSNAGTPELRAGLFNEVDKAFTLQMERQPNDARYRLFYGLFLSRYGWYGRSVEQLEKARDLSPNKQAIYFELANNYLLDQKADKALEAAKKAYDLEQNNSEAKLIYGLVAAATGDTSLANQLLSSIDEQKVVFDDRYLSLLISLNQSEKAISLLNNRISVDPNTIQHRLTLAGVYLQIGQRSNAIRVLEEAVAAFPEFKEQGDYFISEIKAGRNP